MPSSSTTRQDFEVTNGAGVVVYTSSALDIAKAWVKRNEHRHSGLKVEKVTTTTTVERVKAYAPSSTIRAEAKRNHRRAA